MIPKRILIFRIGSLGDTLVAVPAMWRVREAYPDARITLLCDRQAGKDYVLAPDLLRNSGIVDDFMVYPVHTIDGVRRVKRSTRARLLLRLRLRRFDTLIYLAPSGRSGDQVERDRKFFRWAGVGNILGMQSVRPVPPPGSRTPLAPMPTEADLFLERLDHAGVPARSPRIDIGIASADRQRVVDWTARLPPDGGRRWLGVGPGSKMPAKVWPKERYADVVAGLIRRFDIWPVVFGDAGDRVIGLELVEEWGRGHVAAGELDLRASIAALERCAIYLGNDTGTMHMAAAAGVRCVGVFCSHAPPGLWYPYGEGHRVFRTQIDCEGCALQECIERRMECILRITPLEVSRGCDELLAAPRASRTD